METAFFVVVCIVLAIVAIVCLYSLCRCLFCRGNDFRTNKVVAFSSFEPVQNSETNRVTDSQGPLTDDRKPTILNNFF